MIYLKEVEGVVYLYFSESYPWVLRFENSSLQTNVLLEFKQYLNENKYRLRELIDTKSIILDNRMYNLELEYDCLNVRVIHKHIGKLYDISFDC